MYNMLLFSELFFSFRNIRMWNVYIMSETPSDQKYTNMYVQDVVYVTILGRKILALKTWNCFVFYTMYEIFR